MGGKIHCYMTRRGQVAKTLASSIKRISRILGIRVVPE